MEPQSTARNVSEPAASAGNLTARLLTWDDCQDLAPKLSSAEAMECVSNGYTPEQALAAGLLFGLSWAVHRDNETVGAFGFTSGGHIWSLWGPLSRKESVDILRLSREWIPYIVRLSGRPQLTNTVHAANTNAANWLIASGCINIDFANPRRNLDGTDSYAFETFPPQDSPQHV